MIRNLAVAASVMRAQWYSSERLRRLRDDRLAATVALAVRIPFYRRHWHGTAFGDIRSTADLPRLPIVKKADFRAQLSEIVAPGYDETNSALSHTSGSSGATLRMLHDHRNNAYNNAAWVRAHMAYGCAPHHRMAYFRTQAVTEGVASRLGMFRSTHIPFTLSPDEILDRLRTTRPHVLGGYPSHFAELISWLPSQKLRSLGVRWLYCGAETLTAQLADRLREIFDCPLIDLYGTTEFGNVAFQCRYGRRHLCDDTVIVEVVDGHGQPVVDGEIGDIVITGLRNDAMPLIRYRIGDRGSLSSETCPCGRNLTVLSQLHGRSAEAVVVADGRRLPLTLVGEHLRRIDAIYQFQVVQDGVSTLTLNLVCARKDQDRTQQLANLALRNAVGDSMTVTTRVVDRIPRTAGGKVPAVIADR